MEQLYDMGKWEEIFKRLKGYVENKGTVVANLTVLGLRDGYWDQVLKLKEEGYQIEHPLQETFIQYLIHGNLKKASKMINIGLISFDQLLFIVNRLYAYTGENVEMIDDVVSRIHWLQTQYDIHY